MRIAGIATCVPAHAIDNLELAAVYGEEEVRKVVGMAGVRHRRVVDEGVCSSDLCLQAARDLLKALDWDPQSISGLLFVTQSPDYFLPSTACVIHAALGMDPGCAALDVGLGCSGYPYGLYLAATMLRGGGHRRMLVLHGETPSRFTAEEDRGTTLLFGDAGSATAVEFVDGAPAASFALGTDGSGREGLIIRGGGFRDRFPADRRHLHVEMDGAAIFNFTIKRVPEVVRHVLETAGVDAAEIDGYALHQSNQFIMRYLVKKCGLPPERVPIILEKFGNTGGASVPLTITTTYHGARERALRLMLVGYGVGLSWGAAIVKLPQDAILLHREYDGAHGT
jgi:3-oxoacyl-[acyl-carrier-protein] synthase-3